MPQWTERTLATIDTALDQTRRSGPVVVIVDGEAGIGKSTLVEHVVTRAPDFAIRRAVAPNAPDGGEEPYGVLAQWGARVRTTAQGAQLTPFVAAQDLRMLTDTLGEQAPVMLVLDDLQWADAESLETLIWLLRRAAGDRLLVLVAHRPLARDRHAPWRRWVTSRHDVLRVRLTGLTLDAAGALVEEHAPGLPDAAVERLWRHTGGNPLYLRELLAEVSGRDLGVLPALPAPAEYARSVAARLSQTSAEAGVLAEALAVLGSTEAPLVQVTAVAEVPDSTRAVEELLESELVTLADDTGGMQLRWVHALARAAVYLGLREPRRRHLHARAAGVVTTLSAVLEHRVQAAGDHDEALAADLEAHAAEQSARRSHRLAAEYLRRASDLTAASDVRERRWLDSLFHAVLAQEVDALEAELGAVRAAADVARRTLVLGAHAALGGRHREAVAELAVVARWSSDTGDARTRFRVEAILAWSRTLLGGHLDELQAGLARAQALGMQDTTVQSYLLLPQAHVAGRTAGWAAFAAMLATLPQAPSAVPAERSGLLVWRATERVHRGDLTPAIADLREVAQRQHRGQVDVLSNGFDALLAAAQWFSGRWNVAEVGFRAASEVPTSQVGLLTYALSPLPACGVGDFTRADALLETGATALLERPWLEGLELYLAAEVVRWHASHDEVARSALMDRFEDRWPDAPLGQGLNTGVWSAHLALALVWADRPDEAERQLTRAEGADDPTPGLRLLVGWVRALAWERQGDAARALAGLRVASDVRDGELPLYRAHALADRGRVAGALGHADEAREATDAALGSYESLGATPYVDRLRLARGDRGSASDAVRVLPLTEREHDIVTLLVEGYSYAQISRELYVSQSTVSFHLGRVYPKAGVRSRHELTQLIRSHPGMLAPSSTASAE